jgi:hypothetical protein
MKVCSKCHIEKDESEFSKGKSRPCKECCSIAQKEYYNRDIDKSRERANKKAKKHYNEKIKNDPKKLKKVRDREKISAKRYRENNKEKRKEVCHKSYLRNKYKISIYAKEYAKKNSVKIKTRNQERYYKDLERSRKLSRESAKRNYNPTKAIAAAKKFRIENPDIVKKMKREWENKNKTRHLEAVKKRGKKMRDELREAYLKKQLINQGVPKEIIGEELIEIKKTIIQIKRKIKQHGKDTQNKEADK